MDNDTLDHSGVSGRNSGSHSGSGSGSQPSLIGIGGRFGAGKDTVADWLVANRSFTKANLSEPIVDFYTSLDPWIRLDESSEFVRYVDIVDKVGFTAAKRNTEVRAGLQKVAAAGRRIMGPSAWSDLMRPRLEQALTRGERLVVSGVRFSGEIGLISGLGGLTVWIDRPTSGPQDGDVTENSVSAADFDVVVHNHGAIADLHSALDTLWGDSIEVKKT